MYCYQANKNCHLIQQLVLNYKQTPISSKIGVGDNSTRDLGVCNDDCDGSSYNTEEGLNGVSLSQKYVCNESLTRRI